MQICTFLMCSFHNLYGSGWFFRRIYSMWGCFWVRNVWLIRIFFVSEERKILNFKKRERIFFSLFTFFTPFREENAIYPQFREKYPNFFHESAKNSCFILVSAMFRSDIKNSCFDLCIFKFIPCSFLYIRFYFVSSKYLQTLSV